MPTTDERPLEQQLVVPADLTVLSDVRAWVRRRAQPVEFSECDLADIELAVTEAVSNIIRHAYRGNVGHQVSIRAKRKSAQFVISIQDTGPPFAGVPRDDACESPSGGGYGLELISSLMDDATWSRLPDGHNELRLVRLCPKARA
jgi:serine/threonine-protein kinase RsbW